MSPNSNSNSNGNLGIRPKTISNGEVCRAIFKTGNGESGNQRIGGIVLIYNTNLYLN